MITLASQIEAFLLERQAWVPVREICGRFGVNERCLRALDGRPPICSEFALSNSKRGFKHIAFATRDEAMHAYRSRRKHGIGELKSARNMLRRWESLIPASKSNPPAMTRDGQTLLFVCGSN
jgi:hypothetical protein